MTTTQRNRLVQGMNPIRKTQKSAGKNQSENSSSALLEHLDLEHRLLFQLHALGSVFCVAQKNWHNLGLKNFWGRFFAEPIWEGLLLQPTIGDI